MKKLLLVEDEKDLRSLFKGLVSELSLNVHLAANEVDAINKLETIPFDIIILDLHYIGKGSARDIFKYIENATNKLVTEIFIISGYLSHSTIVEEFSYLLNPNNIYNKPDGFFQLVNRLKLISSEGRSND